MAIVVKYRDIVKKYTIATGSLGVTSTLWPVSDAPVMGGMWISMFVEILKKSSHDDISSAIVKKTVLSIFSGISIYLLSCKIFTWILNLIPGVGTLTSIGINSIINALFTYRFGAFCAETLDNPSFDSSDMAYMAQTGTYSVVDLAYIFLNRGIYHYRQVVSLYNLTSDIPKRNQILLKTFTTITI